MGVEVRAEQALQVGRVGVDDPVAGVELLTGGEASPCTPHRSHPILGETSFMSARTHLPECEMLLPGKGSLIATARPALGSSRSTRPSARAVGPEAEAIWRRLGHVPEPAPPSRSLAARRPRHDGRPRAPRFGSKRGRRSRWWVLISTGGAAPRGTS